jgi:hypothetical protein
MAMLILRGLGEKDQADTVKLITNAYQTEKKIEVKVNEKRNTS